MIFPTLPFLGGEGMTSHLAVSLMKHTGPISDTILYF